MKTIAFDLFKLVVYAVGIPIMGSRLLHWLSWKAPSQQDIIEYYEQRKILYKMKRFINNVISVFYSFFRFVFMKLFYGKHFKYYPIERFSPNTEVHFFLGKGFYISWKICEST